MPDERYEFPDILDFISYLQANRVPERPYFQMLLNKCLTPLQRARFDLYFNQKLSTTAIAKEHGTHDYVVSRSLNKILHKLKREINNDGALRIKGDYPRLTNRR